jgi:hypothetical protein
MRIRRFLSVVPQSVRGIALALVGCGTLIGMIMGFLKRTIRHLPNVPHPVSHPMMRALVIDVSIGLFLGCLIAIWLLCLGYVYGDAKRRAMRPVLWVLVTALFPHVLGFLLYFVLRQPIASTCSNCGQTIPRYQRFCSWCGNPQPPATSPGLHSGLGSSGAGPITAV